MTQRVLWFYNTGMKYIVYKTTNMVNSKFYIGVHNGSNDGYLGSGSLLKEAIRKYGRDCFIRETISTFDTSEEAYEYEKSLITDDLISSSDCYNIGPGGYGGDKISYLDPDRKKKIYLEQSIRNTGRKDSDEIREIKSASATERCKTKPHTMPNNKGRKHKGKGLENIRAGNKSKDSCFISNGVTEYKIPKNTQWVLNRDEYYGRSLDIKKKARNRSHSKESIDKIIDASTGITCYNNGVKNIKLKTGESVPTGFKPGMIKKIKNIWATDGKNNLRLREGDLIPAGFKRGRTINDKSII